MRIVSLLPAATEMVCALGLESWLVGRSHECDFPASVEALPVCSSASFPDGSSSAIDREVKERVRSGLSLYQVDFEKLRQLQPDLLLTQDQCEVCAVTLGQVEEGLRAQCGLQAEVFSMHPRRLEDVWSEFLSLATRLGQAPRGHQLLEDWRARLLACNGRSGQRVVALEWLDPLMGCGGWTPELIAMAGAVEVLGQAGQHARWTSLEELACLDPDVFLLIPCGFSLQRALQEIEELGLVRKLAKPCIAWDGNALFNRSGPRLVDSAEWLARALAGESGPHWEFLSLRKGYEASL